MLKHNILFSETGEVFLGGDSQPIGFNNPLVKWSAGQSAGAAAPEVTKGQSYINKLFGATPENPIILPIDNIPCSVSFSNNGTMVILGATALIGVAMVISAILRKK